MTDVAAGYVPLPACDATRVHVPKEIAVTERVETVQTEVVLDETVTVKSLDAETVTLKVSP